MKKFLFLFVTLILLMFLISPVSAKTVREECGCGLGAEAIGEKEGLLWNLLGTFLNGLSGNQTFAMSSGTSQCSKYEKLAKLKVLDKYVSENMDSVAFDIAKGYGESLDAIAEISGIHQNKKTVLYSSLQDNFQEIYSGTNVTHLSVVQKISEIIETL